MTRVSICRFFVVMSFRDLQGHVKRDFKRYRFAVHCHRAPVTDETTHDVVGMSP